MEHTFILGRIFGTTGGGGGGGVAGIICGGSGGRGGGGAIVVTCSETRKGIRFRKYLVSRPRLIK